jgi:deoxyribose-phosphate aldolase
MNIYEHIDYTLLKPTATHQDIWNLCEKAKEKGCASVCIPSCFVPFVADHFPTLTICTVVGFPLGNSSMATKVAEAREAVYYGANEIDMVINIAYLKHGLYYAVQKEIEEVKNAIGDRILKVIIETCYLNEDEIAIATKLVDESSADFVKTSTGFGTRGASFRDIIVMKSVITNGTKIKASGGIRTIEDMVKYIVLGCDRIGASKLP